MKLETERLFLMPITADKFVETYKMFTNDYVKELLFDNQIISQDAVKSFVEESITLFIQKKYGLWNIYTKETYELIGFTGLWHFFNEHQPQLLYALLPQFTKLGYAEEASLKIVEYAFNQLNYNFLDASCDKPNENSHKLAMKIGMSKYKEEIIDEKPITFYRINK